MIRKHENSLALKAGVLAFLVHVLFFLVLVTSFNWKSVEPLQVTEVQLWDSLPQHTTRPVPPPPTPPEPPKPEPKVEPEPKPEQPPEPKAEIAVKKPLPEPKPEPKKKKEEPPKPDPAIKKKEEELQKKKAEEKRQQEALRKLQQMDDDLAEKALSDDAKALASARNAERAQKAAAGAVGANDAVIAKIQAKIRPFVNRQLCGTGKPVLEFSVSLMPGGQIMGSPRLRSSSGIPGCDQAVERAILQAQPLPVPPEPELFSKYRDLKLQFRPNDEN
jgi:colicin import membrane protein